MKKTLKNRSGFLHEESSTGSIKNFYVDKKGQVTIFVIIALIIVAVIFVVMLINKGSVSLREQDFDNPEVYLSACINERARIILDNMLDNGGLLSTQDKVLYNTREISYLCKNINNFEPCINQFPLYVKNIENEFDEAIQADAEQCFSSLLSELESRNYEVSSSGNVNVESKLKPEVVEISFENEITISKSGESRKFSRFDTFVFTKIQSIGFVINEILTQEAKWCYFSNDGFMILYPEYDIRVYMMEDTTKIYTVRNKKTDESVQFATRGCALPAGWF
ncbi:MAG: hypothetical protein AABX10_03450 [Nanoarchaeota archaeon]